MATFPLFAFLHAARQFLRAFGRSFLLLTLATVSMLAQWTIDGYPIQVHGFASQGFAYSNDNNFLTMDTSRGTFDFTDGGLNVSSQISDNFRIGAQVYARSIGALGAGHVTLDWASGDYRFNDWLGIRAGKVKTVLGLYNDTQDEEFLHTWALLPQSMYPLDLRESSLAHTGADLYGAVSVRHLGVLAYTAYAGTLAQDRSGGYAYGLEALQLVPRTIGGSARGADLKWTPHVLGLLLGASLLDSPMKTTGYDQTVDTQYTIHLVADHRVVYSAQYVRGNLRVEGEYSRESNKADVYESVTGPAPVVFEFDHRAWYTAIAYRLSKHLELGTYNSRFFPNADRTSEQYLGHLPPEGRHIFDQVVTARIDFTSFWDFKIEGHFMDGFGDETSFRNFYPQDNVNGLQPKTNLLILRMGMNF